MVKRNQSPAATARARLLAPLLAIAIPAGFMVATATWVVAFVTRLPELQESVTPLAVLFLLLGVQAMGTAIVGARSGSIPAATATGLVAGLIDVLLVGSVVGASSSSVSAGGASLSELSAIAPQALIWIPGSILATTLIGLVGGLLGVRLGRLLHSVRPGGRQDDDAQQTSSAVTDHRVTLANSGLPVSRQAALALAGILATLVLIAVGSLVTSRQAGLSVPDWPRSYGYNMFLYPFTKMVGGIFYEHAHRLIGALVGLHILTLAVWIWIQTPAPVTALDRPPGTGARRWRWRTGALLVLGLVIAQGILGGQRVVLVDRWGFVAALWLSVGHAILAQVFLVSLVILYWSLRWARGDDDGADDDPRSSPVGAEGTNQAERIARWAALLLVIVVGLQILTGAVRRHLARSDALDSSDLMVWHEWALLIHLIGAVLVVALALATLAGSLERPGNAQRKFLAYALLGTVCVQVVLGASAWWITTRYDSIDQSTSNFMVWMTSAHVVTGAVLLLLSCSLTLDLWPRRTAPLRAIRHISELPSEPTPRLSSSSRADTGDKPADHAIQGAMV